MKILRFVLGSMMTNCYFLIDEPTLETMIVDPADNAELILQKLDEKKLIPRAILLTHAHFDHMLALEGVRSKLGIPVLVHRDDAAAITDPDINLTSRFTSQPYAFSPADKLLYDADTVEFGGSSLKVLSTPGHTPGSICLIDEDAVISGDTLFRESIGRYDFPGGDYTEMLRSLDKLTSLEGDRKIYPGHGATTTLSHEREFNPYLIR